MRAATAAAARLVFGAVEKPHDQVVAVAGPVDGRFGAAREADHAAKIVQRAQVVPRVAPEPHGAALVGAAQELHGYLRDAQTGQTGARHHLGVPEPAVVRAREHDRSGCLATKELAAGLAVLEVQRQEKIRQPAVSPRRGGPVKPTGLAQQVVTPSGGDVDAMTFDLGDEARDVARVHFEVDVEEAGDTPRAGGEPGLERRAAAAVAVVEQGAAAPVGRADVANEGAGVVFAPVVDEDDVPGSARLLEDLHDAAHAGAQVARLVVAGDDQRDVGRPAPIGGARRGRHEKMRRRARATSATSPSDMRGGERQREGPRAHPFGAGQRPRALAVVAPVPGMQVDGPVVNARADPQRAQPRQHVVARDGRPGIVDEAGEQVQRVACPLGGWRSAGARGGRPALLRSASTRPAGAASDRPRPRAGAARAPRQSR